ncbi:hypothetical protein [Hahella sp. KA22]|uniref:hypothetical protein n=1 Tax=Hahella sp. KA22 TaxID=1628392 RepID=UPI0013E400B7|nr:hypothetical protein [Hahella sp. KA22]
METGGSAYAGTPENLIHQRPAKLRFNVSDLEQALEEVRAFGITAEIERYAWGVSHQYPGPGWQPGRDQG